MQIGGVTRDIATPPLQDVQVVFMTGFAFLSYTLDSCVVESTCGNLFRPRT